MVKETGSVMAMDLDQGTESVTAKATHQASVRDWEMDQASDRYSGFAGRWE